jgi:hypothetical protein
VLPKPHLYSRYDPKHGLLIEFKILTGFHRWLDDATHTTYHRTEDLCAGVLDDARPRPVQHRHVEDAGERFPHVAVQRVADEHQPLVPAQLQRLHAARSSTDRGERDAMSIRINAYVLCAYPSTSTNLVRPGHPLGRHRHCS